MRYFDKKQSAAQVYQQEMQVYHEAFKYERICHANGSSV